MAQSHNLPELSTADARQRLQIALGVLGIAAAALVVYLPALRGEFILDDDTYITHCALVHSPDGLSRIWFTTEPVDYWPVTYTSFWLEWRLWGMNTTGYHVTNLVLHIACCLLIWRVLSALSIPGAWLAAMLFAVHPVNIQSVAWIAQRKNLLSLFFFLLAILWYVKSQLPEASDRAAKKNSQSRRAVFFWLSLGAFQLAMLSKAAAVSLPLVLLAIVWWQRGRITRSDFKRTLPFFVTTAIWSVVTIWFLSNQFREGVRDASFLQRILGAAAIVWFYLWKAFMPVNLSFIYPKWDIDPSDWRWWLPLAASVTLAAALYWKRKTAWGRALIFAVATYCAVLLPVLGLTDSGYMKHSLVADHYQYIALVSMTALVAATLAHLYKTTHKVARLTSLAAGVAVSAALIVLARGQSRLYADRIALYEATISRNPMTWLIHTYLADELVVHDRLDEAIAHLRIATQLDPSVAQIHCNLAALLVESNSRTRFDENEISEAIDHLTTALRLRPNYVNAQIGMGRAHYVLGNALAAQRKYREAVAQYEKAIELRPDDVDAMQSLGACWIELGQIDKATLYLRRVLKLQPDNVIARQNLEKVQEPAAKSSPGADTLQRMP